MKPKIYQVSKWKMFGFYLWPLLTCLLLAAAFFAGWNKSNFPIGVKLVFAIIIIGIFTVPYCILTYKHWQYFKTVTFKIIDEKFVYQKDDFVIEFNRNDITNATEYWTYSKIYGTFFYWNVEISNSKQIVFSNMLISRSALKKYFGENYKREVISWPSV